MLESRVDDIARSESALRAVATVPEEPSRDLWFKHRVGIRKAFREFWEFRTLIRSLAERDIRVRYKQAILGVAWAVVTPIVMMLAFTLVFTKVGHVATGGIPYPLFSYIALIPWGFFSASVLTGGMSLMSNLALLNKLYCPREVFPLGTVAVAAADALVATLVLIVLFPLEGRWPHWETVYAPIMLVTLLAFTIGCTLAVSAVVVYMRDLRVALPLVMQLALFVTPVAYAASTVAKTRAQVIVFSILNPLVPVIDGLRDTVLLGHQPDWTLQAIGFASASLVLMGGYLLFKKLETGIADIA
jgi:ABC-2 type transport system permease protein/lipopolysaccharide transport system permease protein